MLGFRLTLQASSLSSLSTLSSNFHLIYAHLENNDQWKYVIFHSDITRRVYNKSYNGNSHDYYAECHPDHIQVVSLIVVLISISFLFFVFAILVKLNLNKILNVGLIPIFFCAFVCQKCCKKIIFGLSEKFSYFNKSFMLLNMEI